jgi:hypothetical protein
MLTNDTERVRTRVVKKEEDVMPRVYRAAYWLSADRQASVRLTTEEQAHLSDDDLIAAALAEAEEAGLEIGDGEIRVGEWRE